MPSLISSLYPLSTLVALTLIGGVQHVDASGTKIRGESHLLLVGDPGKYLTQHLTSICAFIDSYYSILTNVLFTSSHVISIFADCILNMHAWTMEQLLGTGKSQFLKFAAKLSNRSVITTGLGSTSAGLTVTAVKDGGKIE